MRTQCDPMTLHPLKEMLQSKSVFQARISDINAASNTRWKRAQCVHSVIQWRQLLYDHANADAQVTIIMNNLTSCPPERAAPKYSFANILPCMCRPIIWTHLRVNIAYCLWYFGLHEIMKIMKFLLILRTHFLGGNWLLSCL